MPEPYYEGIRRVNEELRTCLAVMGIVAWRQSQYAAMAIALAACPLLAQSGHMRSFEQLTSSKLEEERARTRHSQIIENVGG